MSEERGNAHNEWGILVGQSYRLADPAFRADALSLARQTCARARANVERLLEGLGRAGYLFAHPDRTFVPPESETSESIERIEAMGIYIPIFLQAWWIEVGSVNLMGNDPSWPRSGYHGLGKDGYPWYTDPLVIELDESHFRYEHEEWRTRVEEEGLAQVGPFQLSFAPDHIHKANISGGPPYAVDVSAPTIDTLVLNSRVTGGLFHHVANAFEWGGFPGFAYIDEPLPHSLTSLRKLVLPW